MIDFTHITTKCELTKLFGEVGIRSGIAVMVHTSMKMFGYVVNGPVDVIDALIECVDIKEGTILMPSHSGHLTDPSEWKNPPVPESEIEKIRKNMNPFDKQRTPVRNRGIIPEVFLSYPDVLRSDHPLNSVAALGKNAKEYTLVHAFHEPEGLNSPVGKLYQDDGLVLLMGVGMESCTAIHLAEYIADVPYLYESNPKILSPGKNKENEFVRLNRYPGSSKHFNKIMPFLNKKLLVSQVKYKFGTITLFKIKPVVDFIVGELKKDSKYLLEG